MVSLFHVWQEPEARRRARYHVQLEIEDVAEKTLGPRRAGLALVQGRVRQIFRGDASLRLGDAVHFEVVVFSAGDTPIRGGDVHVDRDEVAVNKHVEVMLDGDSPACRLAGNAFRAIGAPSQKPHMRAPSRLECWWIKRRFFLRMWWWRFRH